MINFKIPMDNNKNSYLAYINSVLLTIIMVVSVMAFNSIKNVQNSQQKTNDKVIELSTNQINMQHDISSNTARIKALELDYMTQLRTWVENNFERKDDANKK